VLTITTSVIEWCFIGVLSIVNIPNWKSLKHKNFFVLSFFFSYHETNSNLRISHAAKNKVFSRYYSCNVGNFRGLHVWDVKPSAETERSCV